MVRTKEIEVDGRKITLSMISQQMEDGLQRKWHINRLYMKRAQYMQLLDDNDKPEVKASLDKELQDLDDQIFDASQGYQTDLVPKILRDNKDILPVTPEDESCWLMEDTNRFNKIRRMCIEFKMDDVPVLERTVELFLSKYIEMKDQSVPAIQVITDFKSINQMVSEGEDKKKL